MDLYEVMRTTFAARNFTDDPVPDTVIQRILENARFAPSGGNRQGWRVVDLRWLAPLPIDDIPSAHAAFAWQVSQALPEITLFSVNQGSVQVSSPWLRQRDLMASGVPIEGEAGESPEVTGVPGIDLRLKTLRPDSPWCWP